MFNARAESLTQSPAFRGPFKSQRGIVPMSSFIEWRTEQGHKQPWLITNEDSTLAVAALWDVWRGQPTALLSCTLVTTEAAPEFQPWHSRMPVMLSREECVRWLDNTEEIPPVDPLFRAELKFPLALHSLTSAVGNSRNKNAALLEPVGEVVWLESG
tara:strand:- start:24051 stop:24521 length:471 start_codon:yes stop_codon:yes gene_type:complete